MVKAKTIVVGALAITAIVVFVDLGFWQLDRLKWKTDLLQKIDAEKSVDANAVPLIDLIDNEDNNLRRGYLSGVWADGGSVRVGPKAVNGVWGYWIITPLKLENDEIILINRGWMDDARAVVTANAVPSKSVVKVTGTLRKSDAKSNAVGGDARLWHVLDIAGISKALGKDHAAKLVLFAESVAPADDAGFKPAPVSASLRNAHLQYAIFWFGAAVLLAVLCAFVSLRGRRSASLQDPSGL